MMSDTLETKDCSLVQTKKMSAQNNITYFVVALRRAAPLVQRSMQLAAALVRTSHKNRAKTVL